MEPKLKFALIALGMILLTLLLGQFFDSYCERELKRTRLELSNHAYYLDRGLLPSKYEMTCKNGEMPVPVIWDDSRGIYVIQDVACVIE